MPYLQGADGGQFEHVRSWFASREAPPNMRLLTPEGSVSLFGIVWMGHREPFGAWKASIGTLRPSVVVYGSREGSFEDPLVMDEMYSWIDGLNRWSNLTAVYIDPSLDERNVPNELLVNVKSEPAFGVKGQNVCLARRVAGVRFGLFECRLSGCSRCR